MTTTEQKQQRQEYTPGPWGVEQTATHNWIGPLRRDGKPDPVLCDTDREELTAKALRESDANARLIAAAPELLRELQHLTRLLEIQEDEGTLTVPGLATLNGARAAIAKATGSLASQARTRAEG